MISESFILGYLGKAFGLTMREMEKIALGEIILGSSPEEIKEVILRNCDQRNCLLRSIYNLGINFNQLGELLNINSNFLLEKIDDQYFWFNQLDFKVKSNIIQRRMLGNFLNTNGINLNQIALLLDVAPSTIHADRSYWNQSF